MYTEHTQHEDTGTIIPRTAEIESPSNIFTVGLSSLAGLRDDINPATTL